MSSSDYHEVDGQADELSRGEFLGGAAALAVGGTFLGRVAAASARDLGFLAAAPQRGGTVQIAIGDASTSETLDPQRPWNQNTSIYHPLAWETLLEFDRGFNLRPLLAQSWSSDRTARRWTFHLRPGVRWHDGSPLTARDVVWSIRRIFEPSLASPSLGRLARVLKPKNVRAIDDRTVVAVLSQPDAFFPANFATLGIAIVKAGQSTFSLKNAIGTGPFRFQSFAAGERWAVVRNPTYWRRGLPYLDGVQGVSIPDPTALVQAVTSGSSHLSTSIGFAQIPIVRRNGDTKVLVGNAFLEPYIVMDAKQKPFDDVRVRLAVKLADDRRRVLSAAYQGNGVLTSDTPAPVTDPYYPNQLGIRPQRIAEAKRLLREAGYPDGLQLTLYTSDLLGGMVDMAVAFAKVVEPAGINIDVQRHPAATYFEQIWQQKSFYTTWLNRTHPALRVATTFASYSAWHETNVPNTKVDALLAAAQSTTNKAAQRRRMKDLLRWIANNDGYANAAFVNLAIAAKRDLQGVSIVQAKGPSLVRAWLA